MNKVTLYFPYSKLYGLYNCCYKNYLGEHIGYSHIFRNFIRKIMGLFEEYRNHPDKAVRERANNWGAAIGLQNVDGLSVSEFLIKLAQQQIEGKITMAEVTQKLNEHYRHNKLYSSTYEIVPPDSEMIQQIKEENELRRPKMYEQDSTI